MRNPLSDKIVSIPPSGIRKFFDIVNEMEGAISLGVGEPDFDTPWHIREEGIYSLEKGRTFYTSNAGLKQLKDEICNYLKRRFEVSYDPDTEIMVTVGGSEAIDVAMRAMLNPGDEVLIPQPSYVSYLPCVTLADGVPVIIELEEKDQFKLTPEKLLEKITDKTKILVLPFPNNPTGAIMEKHELEEIAKIVIEKDLFVVTDEIYSELTYQRKHATIAAFPGMKERTVLINGFSKSHAMTGWRLGYMAGPRNILSRLPKLQENMPSCLPEFVQYAGIEALKNGDEDIAMMNRQYAERRKLVLERINGIKGLSCTPPNGAFYAFVNIKETGMTSVEFCEKLLEKEGVVTAPGSAFGEQGEGYVRLSYATSMEQINRGMDRIQRFMESIM